MALNLDLPEKIFGIETAMMLVCLPLVGVLFIFFVSMGQVILPKIDEIKTVSNQIAATDKSTKEIISKQNYINSVDQEELKKNADFLANSLIKEKDAYILVKIVRRIADKYNYYVDSFVINPGVIGKETDTSQQSNRTTKRGDKDDIVEQVPVSMTLAGPKEKYLDFIIGLEKSLPLLSVERMEMTGTEGLTTMDLSVSSYFIGSKLEFNINNLTLADLTLTKEEGELIKRLNQFDYDKDLMLLEDTGKSQKFTKYGLKDPFN